MALHKFLDPKNDYLFRRLFGEERHKDLLIYFINNILHLKGPHAVLDVSYLQTIQIPETATKKQSIIDVLCSDENKNQFIIEMQVEKMKGFEKRAQYYASKVYSNQLNKGELYENLKPVIFISMSDFIMFPNKREWKSSHIMLDKRTYENDLKDFSFTFIELPKFNNAIEHLETVEEKWVYFFKHGHSSTDDEFEKFIGDDMILQKALHITTEHSMTPAEWNAYQQSIKHEMDNRAAEKFKLEEAEEKGMRKGKAEGIAEGKRDIALAMIKAGESLDKISLFTGLSLSSLQKINDFCE